MRETQDEEPGESAGSAWQWLAIGILLGCWLAEAAWCLEYGP